MVPLDRLGVNWLTMRRQFEKPHVVHPERNTMFQYKLLLSPIGIICLLISFVHCNREKTMLFHAGVGQRSSLTDIQAAFQKKHHDVQVNFSFKGSGYFLADISRSREGDLYMPGEEFYLLQAAERGFIQNYDPARDIAAHFITVIITPRGNPKGIKKIEDFAKPGIRVGLGNPRSCAIGVEHERVFKRAGIWEEVQRNAVFSAKCIAELGNAAQHDLVDAAIVWATTAVLYLRDCEIIPLEPKYRGVIRLPVAVMTFSKYPREAQLLKDFILSDSGRAIFLSHAYAAGKIGRDVEGYLAESDTSTDQLMRWLVNAAAVVKNPSGKASPEEVGPLMGEVVRQQKTIRAGN
jgi:molybdate transport system substrate-binding protein